MPSGRLPLRIFAKVLHNIGFDLNKRETAVVGYAFRARGGVDVHSVSTLSEGRVPTVHDCIPGTRVLYHNTRGFENRVEGNAYLHPLIRELSPTATNGSLAPRKRSGPLNIQCRPADGKWYAGTITGARKRELARVRLDSCQHGNKFGDEYWIHIKDLNLLKESGNQLYVQ